MSDNHQRPARYKSGFGNYYYKFNTVLPSGYTIRSTYRGLKKAWCGYKIAKREGDYDKMLHYSEGIQKFHTQPKEKIENNNNKQRTSNELL